MSTPLRELLTGILFDGATRAGFTSDPAAFLQDHGWGELDGADVHDALSALVDDVPLDRAAAIAPVADAAPADAEGLTGAVDGLLLATASVDARFGHLDEADPAAELDRFDEAGSDEDDDDEDDDVGDLDLDRFDETATHDREPTPDDDGAAGDGAFRVEDLADVDTPEDFDGITEFGELEPTHFDVIPELDHTAVDHTDDSAGPDDLDFD
jgi:hypothetical protein